MKNCKETECEHYYETDKPCSYIGELCFRHKSNSSPRYLQTLVRSRLSLNDIHNGDSFKLCEQIEAKSVDMILEDMP